MPGFGSGLAHALTQGYVGARQGQDDAMKQMILLAAQRRQEAQAQQELELKRLSTLGTLASQGFDIGETQPQVAVKDTASVRAVKNENPVSPEAGAVNPQPAEPSQDGTVVGQVGGKTIRVPQGGLVGKAARDDAQKQAQRTQERYDQLNAAQEGITDPKLRRSPSQLRVIAANDALYNKYTEQALGLATDPVAQHRAMRDYDVAHPTRDVTGDNTSWQTVTTADGSMVQVNPKTGATRPIGLQGKMGGGGMSGMGAVQIRKTIAENRTQLSTIDKAIRLLESRPSATGLSKGTGLIPGLGEMAGQVNQRMDPEGEDARNALQNATSVTIVNRSGKAVTKTEMASLGFLPNVASKASENLKKLRALKEYVETENANLEQQAAQAPHPSPTAPTAGGTVHTTGAQTQSGTNSGRTYTYGGVTYHVP